MKLLSRVRQAIHSLASGSRVQLLTTAVLVTAAGSLLVWNVSMINTVYASDQDQLSPAELKLDIAKLRKENATLINQNSTRDSISLDARISNLPNQTGATINRFNRRVEKSRRTETTVHDLHIVGTYSVAVETVRQIERWLDYRIRTLDVSTFRENQNQVIVKLELVGLE